MRFEKNTSPSIPGKTSHGNSIRWLCVIPMMMMMMMVDNHHHWIIWALYSTMIMMMLMMIILGRCLSIFSYRWKEPTTTMMLMIARWGASEHSWSFGLPGFKVDTQHLGKLRKAGKDSAGHQGGWIYKEIFEGKAKWGMEEMFIR